jgi:predicted transglutaminase-like cysteine proteinase
MPPVLSRATAHAMCAASAEAYVRVLARRGLWMLPAAAVALLLLPAGIGEGTAMPVRARPFAPAGVYSTDFTGFPKWRGMLERFARQLADPDNADARAWRSLVDGLRGGDKFAQLRAVNTAVNGLPYVADVVNWGRTDFWETPIEFLRHGGDCEDYAVSKYMALQALGVPVDDMRVAVVDDQQLGVTHAVLRVAVDGRYYLLDNLTDAVVPVAEASAYRPIYAINQHGWWNYGPPPAASAAGP